MFRHLGAAVLALLFAAAPARAADPKIQVLIITGQNGHDWRGTTPVLRELLENTGRFDVHVTEEFRGASAATLAPYDLVVLNYYDKGQPALRWGDATETALLSFVQSGKGLVVYHFSTAAFNGWTEFEKMSAGNWRPNNGHHSAAHDFVVSVQKPEHPILRGLTRSLQQPHDELYANLRWQTQGTYTVLATAWDDHSLYGANAKQPIPGKGLEQPMLWTVDYGKGRVFVTALGHDVPAVRTPTFGVTFTRGAEWAATGEVTLPVPTTLLYHPEPPTSSSIR